MAKDEVTWRHTTQDDIEVLMSNLRMADWNEWEAAGVARDMEAILTIAAVGGGTFDCRTGLISGEAKIIYGCSIIYSDTLGWVQHQQPLGATSVYPSNQYQAYRSLRHVASLWLISTADAPGRYRSLHKALAGQIDEMGEHFGFPLIAEAWNGNPLHQDWLEWMGFEVFGQKLVGARQEPFTVYVRYQ